MGRNVDPDAIGSRPKVVPAEPAPDTLTIEEQIEALERHTKALEAGRTEALGMIGDLLFLLGDVAALGGPQGALAGAAIKKAGLALAKRGTGTRG